MPPAIPQRGGAWNAALALQARRLSGSTASTSSACRHNCTHRRRPALRAVDENGEDFIELTYSAEVMPPGDVITDEAMVDDDEEGEEDDEDEDEGDDEPEDWWTYWQDPPDDVPDDSHEKPLRMTAKEKVADLLERLPQWRERDDFVAPLPVPTVKEYERVLPEHAPPPLNPDWDPWDFRAHVEKKKRKARERAAWEASMAEVGRYEYLSVTADNDIRLKARGEPAKEWTDEEIWDFITLNGTAVDPRRVKGLVRVRLYAGQAQDFWSRLMLGTRNDLLESLVEDPIARTDILEQGGRYIESTEDFLRRTGHWLETELPEEEIDAQLASDFADFAEPELQADAGVDDGAFRTLARVEEEEDGEPAEDGAGDEGRAGHDERDQDAQGDAADL